MDALTAWKGDLNESWRAASTAWQKLSYIMATFKQNLYSSEYWYIISYFQASNGVFLVNALEPEQLLWCLDLQSLLHGILMLMNICNECDSIGYYSYVRIRREREYQPVFDTSNLQIKIFNHVPVLSKKSINCNGIHFHCFVELVIFYFFSFIVRHMISSLFLSHYMHFRILEHTCTDMCIHIHIYSIHI